MTEQRQDVRELTWHALGIQRNVGLLYMGLTRLVDSVDHNSTANTNLCLDKYTYNRQYSQRLGEKSYIFIKL